MCRSRAAPLRSLRPGLPGNHSHVSHQVRAVARFSASRCAALGGRDLGAGADEEGALTADCRLELSRSATSCDS